MPCSSASCTAKSHDRTAWLNRYGSERARASSIERATSGVSGTVTPAILRLGILMVRFSIAILAVRRIQLSGTRLSLSLEKAKEIGVDLILMRRRDAVRCARIVDFPSALDEPSRFLRRVLDGNDLVVFTVHDQGWDIEFLEVLRLICFGARLDAFVGVLEAGLHAP